MQSSTRLIGFLGVFLAVAPLAAAERVTLRRDTVVPVRFEDEIRLSETRIGDSLSARVEDGRDLPRGTRLLGRIVDVERRDGRTAAQLEFNRLELPDGQRLSIRAVPVSLDSKDLRRERDGRISGRRKQNREGAFWGALGVGTVLGALLDKPFEGAFLGAIAGILIAETGGEQGQNGDVLIRRGDRMGAWFERELRYTYLPADREDRWADRDDRDAQEDRWADREDRRDDRWERDDDFRRDITVMGRRIRFAAETPPIRQGELWYVPVETTARQVGLSVESLSQGRRWLIESEETSIVLELDSDRIRRNGRSERIEGRVMRRNGVIYVPSTLFDSFNTERADLQ